MISIRMCVYVSGVQVLPRKSQTLTQKPKIFNN